MLRMEQRECFVALFKLISHSHGKYFFSRGNERFLGPLENDKYLKRHVSKFSLFKDLS